MAESRLLNHLSFVEDGEELMDYLRRQGKYKAAPRPGLILLDLNMPKMDGRQRHLWGMTLAWIDSFRLPTAS